MRPGGRIGHIVDKNFSAELAVAALGFLAAEPDRLERFLAMSGLGPHNLREAAAEPTFLGAVLDYVAADEPLLIGFAESRGLSPDLVVRARDALSPSGPAAP